MYSYIIVDDEPLIRKGTRKKLESMDKLSCAGEASNGEAALELIRGKDPDLIITDMKMPIMDGTELLPVISSQYPDKYIIVISGYKDFEYMQHALRAKSIDYLVKPFSRQAILDAAGKAVEALDHMANRQKQMEMNESEKELLRFGYDKELLKNMLLGNHKGSMTPGSERLKFLQSCQGYRLVTMDLDAVFPEEDLDLFLSERQTHVYPLVLGYHGADNVGFLLLFFREASDKEIQTIVYKYIELLEGYFTGIARRARYGISGFHDSFDGLHEAFLETGSAFNAMAMRMNLPYLFSDRLPMEQVTLNWQEREEFLFRMEDGDAREAEKLLTNLFDYFAHSFCHLKTAKEYCISLTEELKELMPRELPVNRTKTLSLNLMNHLSVIFSFQELWEYFRIFYRNLAAMFQKAKVYGEKDVTENIRRYIEKNYWKDLSVEFVASLFHLNRSYLSSCFKQRVGVSFVDYVNSVRIAHARELLTATDKKMYQVAQAVGYENVKYFFRVFKKIEGVTPEQYRENGKKQNFDNGSRRSQ